MTACTGEADVVDFLSFLPPEVVLRVALALSARDVTRCLLVCRSWCSRLGQLEPYWRVACRRMGLSGSMVQKFGPLHDTARELYLAAQNHKRGLAALPPITCTLTQGYPFDIRYSHQYAREGSIIGTVYQHFKPREIVVEAVRGGKLTRTHTLDLAFERRPENRVIWGHLFGCVYVCATASGRWTAYDLHTCSSVFSWHGDPMYDTELSLGCCELCALVVMSKLVSFHNVDEQSFWDLRFIRLGLDQTQPRSYVLRFKLYHGNRDIVGRTVAYGKRKVCLVSEAPPTGGTCSTHLVLLQWANAVAGYVLTWKGNSASLSRHPHLRYSAPCETLDSAVVSRGGLNTEMTLSADSQLLALVFQTRLHVWNLWSARELSAADLPPHMHKRFERIRLLALGHFYTVIGLEFSTSLLVLLTHTGQVVKRCSDFARQHSHMLPPYTELLCVSNEQWLSDIAEPCTATRCMVVFWNKTNRSLEAVLLGEGGAIIDNNGPEVARRKPWWKKWKS